MRRPHFVNLLAYIVVVLIFLTYISYFSQPKINDEEPEITSKHRPPRAKPHQINPHNFHVMMSNPRLCSKENVKLLIMVASTAGNFLQRKAVRETWGDSTEMHNAGTKILFLLANPDDKEVQRKVVEEFRTYGDLMQEDFLESYMNLPLKTIMGIKWAMQYCQVTHIMKTDDDIYVNAKYLSDYLNRNPLNNTFLGCIKQKKSFQPVMSSSGGTPPNALPSFVAGAGYVFSGSLLKKLFEASINVKSIPVEDVYVTAYLAKSIGAHPPKHNPKFSCGEIVVDDCNMKKAFTGHKITPQRMYFIKNKLDRHSKQC